MQKSALSGTERGTFFEGEAFLAPLGKKLEGTENRSIKKAKKKPTEKQIKDKKKQVKLYALHQPTYLVLI